MNIAGKIAEELDIREEQAAAVIKLLDDGATVPFIARYRKEQHGSLDDGQVRTIFERLAYLRNLEARKKTVISAIEEQGKLTDELAGLIEKAETMVEIEDLYRPYRQKRRTRATAALEKGLEPLAGIILAGEIQTPLDEAASDFVSPEKGVADAGEAIAGAKDIIAEKISDSAEFREGIRTFTRKTGVLVSKVKDENADEGSVYQMYYDFREPVKEMSGYRVLAVNRGENEKILTVKIEVDERQIILYIGHFLIKKNNPNTVPALISAIEDSYRRLIGPSVEREIRNELTEKAEDGAIKVFDKNLEGLLMQPPVAGQVVLGWDPGYAHGSKLAVVDATGKVLDTAIIYPVARSSNGKVRPKDLEDAKNIVKHFIAKYHVTLISLGNGTASRECEQVVAEILREIPVKVSYVITNEAGASVYSASKLGAEEFPDFDPEQRGAVSMARRVQDPLAELVKIDPKAIGVGQYQHDMNQKKLDEALSGVVEDCVNRVGVDLNTASVPLMEHIAGITKTTAKNIVAYRETNGRFMSRQELLKVKGLGPKAFEQCSGFMRIADGAEPLDNTGVHPESYGVADKLLTELGLDKDEVLGGGKQSAKVFIKEEDYAGIAERLGTGEPTLRDIVKELNAPGRDPRSDMPPVVLRSDVMSMEDLKVGMTLKGTVRNVVDFGAFVDIGVHQDGLVHISQLSDKKFVKSPMDVVSVGDIVNVRVVSVDLKRHRIGLSMRNLDK